MAENSIIHQAEEVEENNTLPMSFVGAVVETGQNALRKWLVDNAPAEVVNLAQGLDLLYIDCTADVSGMRESGFTLDALRDIAQGVEFVGCTWHGSDSIFGGR